MKRKAVALLLCLSLIVAGMCAIHCAGDDDPSTSSGQADDDASPADDDADGDPADDDLTDDDEIDDDADDDIDDDDDDTPDPFGLTWVYIPAGSFAMGCSPGDDECGVDELPRHTVSVSAFEMSAYEITQEQYAVVMGPNPSHFQPCPICPVDSVNRQQATDFCSAVGGRLPSEAEWEYAARAGATTRYICGDDPACLDAVAWYADNAADATHPVGEKGANAFGLYDVSGNVAEWCADWYAENYYAVSPAADPTGPVEATGFRVIRGGNWNNGAWHQRVSFRYWDPPEIQTKFQGFRCAR